MLLTRDAPFLFSCRFPMLLPMESPLLSSKSLLRSLPWQCGHVGAAGVAAAAAGAATCNPAAALRKQLCAGLRQCVPHGALMGRVVEEEERSNGAGDAAERFLQGWVGVIERPTEPNCQRPLLFVPACGRHSMQMSVTRHSFTQDHVLGIDRCKQCRCAAQEKGKCLLGASKRWSMSARSELTTTGKQAGIMVQAARQLDTAIELGTRSLPAVPAI